MGRSLFFGYFFTKTKLFIHVNSLFLTNPRWTINARLISADQFGPVARRLGPLLRAARAQSQSMACLDSWPRGWWAATFWSAKKGCQSWPPCALAKLDHGDVDLASRRPSSDGWGG
jgi:hypothetical protein